MQICEYMYVPKRLQSAEPRPAVGDAVELLKALASTARMAIVLELAGGSRCVHELVEATRIAQPRVSQELRVLRAASIVKGTRRGRETAYALADHHVAHIAQDAVNHAQEIRA
jgi:ArsR family transcriptional regulator, zinc-responsive transcriptional repressor